MSTQQILGAVGAVVGAYFGNPQLGYAIGSAIGGAIDPEIIKGPSVGDIATQTSREGVPRPMVFALSQPIAGNIIASGAPRVVRKRKSQGKGGPKVETESVYRTYAIGVCEGPITRFVRIWRNGTLVYNADDAFMVGGIELDFLGETIVISGANSSFLNTARLFLGGWDQSASPDLEAAIGVGITPTHRGTAYLVMANEDLTDLRGAIPQYVFQVERCEGYYLTSRPYPIEDIEALASVATVRDAPHPLFFEAMETQATIEGGLLGAVLETYSNGLPEALDTAATFESGELREALLTYEDALPEALDTAATFESGELREALLAYDDALPEALDSSAELISGSLT